MEPSPDRPRASGRGFLKLRPVSLDLGDVLAQIVAVALGVVLGFGVTSWSEHLRQRSLFHDTIGTILGELKANQHGLRIVMKEHASLAAASNATLHASNRSLSIDQARRMLKGQAFRQNIPLAIAWQIAQSDQGLTLLPFEDRYDLAWIYQLQSVYYDAEQRLENSVLTFHDVAGGNYFIEMTDLANQLTAVVAAERQLDAAYSEAIKRSQNDRYR